jgi:hypothetical protein
MRGIVAEFEMDAEMESEMEWNGIGRNKVSKEEER